MIAVWVMSEVPFGARVVPTPLEITTDSTPWLDVNYLGAHLTGRYPADTFHPIGPDTAATYGLCPDCLGFGSTITIPRCIGCGGTGRPYVRNTPAESIGEHLAGGVRVFPHRAIMERGGSPCWACTYPVDGTCHGLAALPV